MVRRQRPIFKIPWEETPELITRWTEECSNLLCMRWFHIWYTANGYLVSEAFHVDEMHVGPEPSKTPDSLQCQNVLG